MKNFMFLAVAIVCEVIGTNALKDLEKFSKLGASLLTTAMMG